MRSQKAAKEKAEAEKKKSKASTGGPLPNLNFLGSLGNTKELKLDNNSQTGNLMSLSQLNFASTINGNKLKIETQPDSARFLNKSDRTDADIPPSPS